jgi:beta-N-acetylhexosaminidase
MREVSGVRLRPYAWDADEGSVHALWLRAFGPTWPISRQGLRRVLNARGAFRSGDHLVVVAGGAVVGFVATQYRTPAEGAPADGSILAVAVDPAYRRQGIGYALVETAVESLRARGAQRVHLGSGGVSYFWPGVPDDPPESWAFFARTGWEETEISHDLLLPLAGYAPPPAVLDRARAQAVDVGPAGAADAAEVLAFERRHFPSWVAGYERALAAAPADVVARGAGGQILGAALAAGPRPAGRSPLLWTGILGPDTGSIGAVGVAPEARGRGTGLALAAVASGVARARGAARCLAGWTWLTDWYGQLGYRPWRRYRMSVRTLSPSPQGAPA